MPSKPIRFSLVVLFCTLLGAIVGCGSAAPSNLSPAAQKDPERYQRAVRESEEKIRRDQEAEREAFRGMNKNLPK